MPCFIVIVESADGFHPFAFHGKVDAENFWYHADGISAGLYEQTVEKGTLYSQCIRYREEQFDSIDPVN